MPSKSQYEAGAPPATLQQYRNLLLVIAMFFALTVMVFMRKKVGLRKLKLSTIFGAAFALYVLNLIGNFHMAIPLAGNIGATYYSESLRNFALAFLGLALWQRRQRWMEFRHGGAAWHTLSHGISYLEGLLPIRNDRIYRFADPISAFLSGAVIHKIGFAGLGLWIMLSAVSLKIVEEHVYERQLDNELDMVDALLESRVQGEVIASIEVDGDAQARTRSRQETGGIPTGSDPDLEMVIARRKKESAMQGAAGLKPEVRI